MRPGIGKYSRRTQSIPAVIFHNLTIAENAPGCGAKTNPGCIIVWRVMPAE